MARFASAFIADCIARSIRLLREMRRSSAFPSIHASTSGWRVMVTATRFSVWAKRGRPAGMSEVYHSISDSL